MVLPSASVQDTYSNNTISNYTIPLPYTKRLDGPWYAALIAAGFPNNIINIDKTDATIVFKGYKNPREAVKQKLPLQEYNTITFQMPAPSNIGSPATFIDAFHNAVGIEKWLQYHYYDLPLPDPPVFPSEPVFEPIDVPPRPSRPPAWDREGLRRYYTLYQSYHIERNKNEKKRRRWQRQHTEWKQECDEVKKAYEADVARIRAINATPKESERAKIWKMKDIVHCTFDVGTNRFRFDNVETNDDRFEKGAKRKMIIFQPKLANMLGITPKQFIKGYSWDSSNPDLEPQVNIEEGQCYVTTQQLDLKQDDSWSDVEETMIKLEPNFDLANSFGAWTDLPQVLKPHDMIYFHMDHIAPSYVSDKGVRMIGFSDVSVAPSEYQWKYVQSPIYKRVIDDSIHHVNIKTVDSDGDQIRFGDSAGEVVLLVHFVQQGTG